LAGRPHPRRLELAANHGVVGLLQRGACRFHRNSKSPRPRPSSAAGQVPRVTILLTSSRFEINPSLWRGLGEWRGGVSPPRSPRTGREPLGSSGSQYPAVFERLCLGHAAPPVTGWPHAAAGYRSPVQSHYRTFTPTTGCSAPVPRIGTLALAGASRLSGALRIGTTGSRVPQQSLIRVHAASKPGPARAGLQGSARTQPGGHYLPPGFDAVL
jgi:hypothetical protein